MSFDIFFHTCNLGSRKKRSKNPFTGKSITTFDDPGLTDEERGAVAELVRTLNAEGPDDFGFYTLLFADGGGAELYAKGLANGAKCDGCSVQTHGLTSDLVSFLFQLSRRGNMILTPAATGVGSLATSEEQRQRTTNRFPDAKVVRSAAALEKELRRGFEAWQRYRDQVIGEEE